MNSTDYPATVIYNFLFDRMRAVRQDLYTQGIVVRHVPSHLSLPCLLSSLANTSGAGNAGYRHWLLSPHLS